MISALILSLAATAMEPEEVTIPGPEGPLAGTLVDPGANAPAIVIIPGSGPTDRNGDNKLAGNHGMFRQLAEALAERGIATLRADKRGMFGSSEAIPDANNVRLADYVDDARGWAGLLAERGKPCAWLMGHSEGGLVANLAAQDPEGLCGIIIVAGPGETIGTALRAQLSKQLPPAWMEAVEAKIAILEGGEHVDPSDLPHPSLQAMFGEHIQGFLIDMLQQDPGAMIANVTIPVLLIYGSEDIQIPATDGKVLAEANPNAKLVTLEGLNHVLANVPVGDMAANMATYRGSDAKLDMRVVDAIAAFVKGEGK